MSGGRFNYRDSDLCEEIFGWRYSYEHKNNEMPPNVFEDREVSNLIYDVFQLIHDFDWYYSGDTSKDTYLEKKAAFKKKWLGNNRGLRVKQTIDTAIEELREEMYESFGVKDDDKT